MSDNIVWEDPAPAGPSFGPRQKKWNALLDEVARRPNEWALVQTKTSRQLAHATATNLRLRKVTVPPGEWEFVARRREGGDFGVFARYLGGAA